MYRTYSEIEQPCLMQGDRKKCSVISNIVIFQCLLIFAASTTVLHCFWSPEKTMGDFNKLARIMYLYDYRACRHTIKKPKTVVNLQFSNDTAGLNVLPIKWLQAIPTVSTKLSTKTRKYIELSLIIHGIWMILAIGVHIFTRSSTDIKIIKFTLTTFFYACVSVVFFDLSMAIVYIAHIKQSLSKGMVLRYSGWSVVLKLTSYDEFAGWLPIVASICWMKGIVILALNIYCCKVITIIRKKIRRREVKLKITRMENQPIPDPYPVHPVDRKVLIYRRGEREPYVKKYFPF